jgi:hypothetical protein
VYIDTMKKRIKSKNKNAIGPESVDGKTDPDKEDKQMRKIPALMMSYLPVINHLKCVLSNPRDAKLVRWHCEKHKDNDEDIQHPAAGTQ